jgi:hypothetical protein
MQDLFWLKAHGWPITWQSTGVNPTKNLDIYIIIKDTRNFHIYFPWRTSLIRCFLTFCEWRSTKGCQCTTCMPNLEGLRGFDFMISSAITTLARQVKTLELLKTAVLIMLKSAKTYCRKYITKTLRAVLNHIAVIK